MPKRGRRGCSAVLLLVLVAMAMEAAVVLGTGIINPLPGSDAALAIKPHMPARLVRDGATWWFSSSGDGGGGGGGGGGRHGGRFLSMGVDHVMYSGDNFGAPRGDEYERAVLFIVQWGDKTDASCVCA